MRKNYTCITGHYAMMNAVAILLTVLLSGCGSIQKAVYKNPAIHLAYPSEMDVVKDQSQITSIVIGGGNYGLTIDGINFLTPNGQVNTDLRVANDAKRKTIRVVDLLPGEHNLELSYSNFSGDGVPGSGSYVNTYTEKPVKMELYMRAGEIYYLNLSGLEPLPDNIKQMVIECRNRSTFSYKEE